MIQTYPFPLFVLRLKSDCKRGVERKDGVVLFRLKTNRMRKLLDIDPRNMI
jgi:hypothetical protein